MKKFKSKTCKKCEVVFTPTAPAQRYCKPCGEIAKLECYEREREKLRTGIGSGNYYKYHNLTHPSYKNGIGKYKQLRDEIAKEIGYVCQHCGIDLDKNNPHKWCGHHKDHDRTNNSKDNIEVICKSCHQIEHRCWENFTKGATTIPKGSTP